MGTIFRETMGGAGGPPQGNPNAGAVSKRESVDDLLSENSRIMGSGEAGETLGQFGTCWDGKVTNQKNPARRDVAQLMANSYIVLQWNQDNPGIWREYTLFVDAPYCKITDHLNSAPLPHRMALVGRLRLDRPRAPRGARGQDARRAAGHLRRLG